MRLVPTTPPDPTFWLLLDFIILTQAFQFEAAESLYAEDDGLLRRKDKIWTPRTADELKLKLLTIAHTGQAGHR